LWKIPDFIAPDRCWTSKMQVLGNTDHHRMTHQALLNESETARKLWLCCLLTAGAMG
jgi:hypothetical protein